MSSAAEMTKKQIEKRYADQWWNLVQDYFGLTDKELKEAGFFREGEESAASRMFGRPQGATFPRREGPPPPPPELVENPAYVAAMRQFGSQPGLPSVGNDPHTLNRIADAYTSGGIPGIENYIRQTYGGVNPAVNIADSPLMNEGRQYGQWRQTLDQARQQFPRMQAPVVINQPGAPDIDYKIPEEAREVKRQEEERNIPPEMAPDRSFARGFNRLAPLPPSILKAIEMMEGNTGAYKPFLQAAQQAATEGGQNFPEARQAYMNPYIQDVTNRIEEEGLRTLQERILPQLERTFVSAGQHGGSRHQELAQRAARDIQSEILARKGQALHAGYGQAAQIHQSDALRKLQQAQALKGLGAHTQAGLMADVGGLTDVGRISQAQKQHGLAMDYEDYMRQKQRPHDIFAQRAAFLSGVPYNTTQNTYTSQMSPQNPQLSIPTMLGSAGLQLLGQSMMKRGGRVKKRKKR